MSIRDHTRPPYQVREGKVVDSFLLPIDGETLEEVVEFFNKKLKEVSRDSYSMGRSSMPMYSPYKNEYED